MKIRQNVELGRLIGKVDNDFNISESDWIPRAAAWIIDALSQMKVLPMERKKRTLNVNNRIALFPCTLNAKEIKVFDSNGCEIRELNNSTCSCNSGLNDSNVVGSEIAVFAPNGNNPVNSMKVTNIIPTDKS